MFSVSTVSSSAMLSDKILKQLDSDLSIGDEMDLEKVMGVLEHVDVSLVSFGGVLIDEFSVGVS